jgi:hypothetical protein
MGLKRQWKRLKRRSQAALAELDRRRRSTRDVVLISYPKSGRTWVRFMLDAIDVRLLYDHVGAENRSALPIEQIDNGPAQWADWRMVFLARDPRDTVVSSYFEATKRLKERHRFAGTVGEFMRDPRYGVEKIARYNLLWLEAGPRFKAFLPMSYERLHEDTFGEVRRLLDFVRRKPGSGELVDRAVGAGRFDKMRRVEEALGLRMNEKNKLGGGRPGDVDSLKTRRGKVGGWQDYFEADDSAYTNEVLTRLDYWPRIDAVLGRRRSLTSDRP